MGRRRRYHDESVDDDSKHDDDAWGDSSAREAQLPQHGQQRFVELQRRFVRTRRADEPLTAGRRAADPRPPALTYSESVTEALTLQMLTWLDERPRGYAETLEAWRTSCPRLSIWEDALADGLIRIAAGRVQLTPAGRALVGQFGTRTTH